MATQAEINEFVEQIMPYFDPAPIEDDSVQQSWPRLDRGLSDMQDMRRFQHLYGIFDRGGGPFRLRKHATDGETNSRNTMFLSVSSVTGTAESTMNGCFHVLRQDLELEFPPVSSPTTQYVVDEYDPVRAADGGDPIVSKVVTSLDRAQGKNYIVHHAVDRRPSQLLTDAPVRRFVPRVVGTILVASRAELPEDPSSLLFGTVAEVTGTRERFQAVASNPDAGGPTEWRSLSRPGGQSLPLSDGRVYAGHGARPEMGMSGGRISLKGRIRRSSGDFTASSSDGWWIATLPASHRPAEDQACMVAGGGSSTPQFGKLVVESGGNIRLYPVNTVAWVDLSGVPPFEAAM